MELPFKGKISFEEHLWAQKHVKDLRRESPWSRRILDGVYLLAIIGIFCSIAYQHGPLAIGSAVIMPVALYICFIKWLGKYSARQHYDNLCPLDGSVQETKIILKGPFTELHLEWNYFHAFVHHESAVLLQYNNDYLVLSQSQFRSEADWHRCIKILAAGIKADAGAASWINPTAS